MPWLWGSLFDYLLKATVIIREKNPPTIPTKISNDEKLTTARPLLPFVPTCSKLQTENYNQ